MSIPSFVARTIEHHLQEIAGCFKDGAKLTLLVRNGDPSDERDADLVMTIDELPLAIAALQRRQAIFENGR